MDKTGQCEGAPRTSEDAAPIDDTIVSGWHSWGSCRWGIDAGGTLWITPAAGRTEGTAQSLPKGETWIESSYGNGAPWRSRSKDIRSVKVLGTVHLVGYANRMFAGLTHCKDMDLTGLDTSGLQDMTRMFYRCLSLTSLDLSGWDTSGVRSMEGVFNNCRGLVTLDLSGWDTPQVESTAGMFCTCSSLVSLDLSGWDTSRAEDLASMLFGCSSLRELRLGPAFSFRPCVSFSGYRTRQSSPPNPPMTPPYSGNWAREDGSCELDARKLALRYGPALSGTWVWAHGTPSASPCASATGLLAWSQDEDSKGQEPGSLRLGVYGLVRRLQRSEVSRFLSFELDPRDEADRSDAITLYLNGREGDFRVYVSSSLGWVSLKGERIWFVMDEHRDGLSYQDLQDDIVYGGALGEGAYGEMLDLLFETVCVLASATDVFHDEVADEQRLCAPDPNPFDDCSYDVYVRNEHAGPCTKTLANISLYVNCDPNEAECEPAAADQMPCDT